MIQSHISKLFFSTNYYKQLIFFILFSYQFLSFCQSLDQLQYKYNTNNNQLNHIKDVDSASASTDDLDNQDLNNYRYDLNGQLSKDAAEGILEIKWTISGKVKQVNIDDNADGAADRTLQFKYDAIGNRIKKVETAPHNSQLIIYVTQQANC